MEAKCLVIAYKSKDWWKFGELLGEQPANVIVETFSWKDIG